MENQHQKIRGYRDLSEAEIDLMNGVKDTAAALGELAERLEKLGSTDKRWVAIAMNQASERIDSCLWEITRVLTCFRCSNLH
jgi:hypothetical protein